MVERPPPEWDPAHQADEVAATVEPTETIVVDGVLPAAVERALGLRFDAVPDGGARAVALLEGL